MSENIYYSFTEAGETPLPSKEIVLSLFNEGIKPVVFIDSCVCLDIIKTIDYKSKAQNVNRMKLINLKNYIAESHINISPLFGLMELCYKEDVFDEKKFWDFKNRIDFFLQLPNRTFKKMKYDYTRDYLILKEPSLNRPNPYYGLDTFILHTYASLLKIRQLALKGLSKKIAEENCLSLINWMTDELGIILGIEYKLGMNVFGGASNFRKMLGIDVDVSQIKKKLIGTAWDILHSRFCTNNLKLSRMLNESVNAYFLTDDYNLYKLLHKFNLSLIVDNVNRSGMTTLSNSDYDLPHLDKTFLDTQNRLMINLLAERFNRPTDHDLVKVKSIIKHLEQENNIGNHSPGKPSLSKM